MTISTLIAELFIVIRNARAMLVALVLLGALIWVLWETSATRTDLQELDGQLISLAASGNKPPTSIKVAC